MNRKKIQVFQLCVCVCAEDKISRAYACEALYWPKVHVDPLHCIDF